MNVFVSEYLCSGASELSRADASLLTEGAAMLDAVISDLLAIPDCNVMTCVQEQLPTYVSQFKRWDQEQRLQVKRVRDPEEERDYFDQACRHANCVWIIAPEFDQILYSRTERAIRLGARVIGPDSGAIKLTADKWRLFQFLNASSLATIPTSLIESESSTPTCDLPCVIKHRFGAGGLGLSYLTQLADWREKLTQIQKNRSDYIVQPFISGTMLSTVVLITPDRRELFPIGEQQICWSPGFQYQGGSIPAELDVDVIQSVQQLLEHVCDVLPGLAGYVGFDLLLPEVDPTAPLIVEINPRLTTSYTGYRQLTADNLAARIVNLETEYPCIRWEADRNVQFRPDGSILLNPVRF